MCLNIPLDKNKGGQQSVGADIIEIAKLVDAGWSYKKIALKFGINSSVAYRLIKRYKLHGLNAVLHKEHKTYTIDEKLKIINL